MIFYKFFSIFLALTIFNSEIVNAHFTSCNCYNYSSSATKIRNLINESDELLKTYFFYDLPFYREKWEKKYIDQFEKMGFNKPKYCSLRYPEIHHKFQIADQKIDLIKEYWIENFYECYMGPGWIYNLEEKKQRNAREKTRVINNSINCKKELSQCLNEINQELEKLYKNCLDEHISLLTLYDYGLMLF